MLKTRFDWILLIFLALAAGGGWIVASQEPTLEGEIAAVAAEAPFPGYQAPNFTLTTITGETVDLAAWRGQPVVLNFWATWCPPCRAEMPFFQAASVKYHGRVAILGVNQDESLSEVSRFGLEMGLSYPLLLDPQSRVNRLYQVRALPTTLFIDEYGVVRELFPGVINQAVLEDRIERLLGE